ncbi:MAG: PD40 domain-containing protein [Spirochaetales bacterium]|nr:PD40 domain-containing protein [Spirochaetales bacterium]
MLNIKFSVIVIFITVVCVSLFADDALVWKETKTEHFVFVFQQQDKQAAAELASVCEDVYRNVSEFFNSSPATVRCVIRGQVDYANGSYSPMPDHLELFVRSPTGPWLGARSEQWLKLLLTHELAHYIDLVSNKGFFYTLSLFMGEGVRAGSAGFWPMWLIEGIAVNLETDFSKGGRGRNAFFEMTARAMAKDHKQFNLGQLEYSSVYPPSGRFYLYGYFLINYLRRHYGDDIYQRVRDSYLDFPFFGPWGALVAATGKHQDVLLAEMYDELNEIWADDFTLPQGDLVSPDEYADYALPAPVPGGYITWRTSLTKAPAFVLLDSSFKEVQVLFETSLYDSSSFGVSADGKLMVFSALLQQGSNNDAKTISELYRMDISYSGAKDALHATRVAVKRLTSGGRLWHPAVSPDGTQCIAVKSSGSYSRLVRIDLTAGGEKPLLQLLETNMFNPVFSPDGKKIVLSVNTRGFQDICIMDLSKLPAVVPEIAVSPVQGLPDYVSYVLGPDNSGDYFPRFAGDDTVLFTSDRNGTLALYSINLTSKILLLVHADPVGVTGAFENGNAVVYTSMTSRGDCIRLMDNHMLLSEPVALPAVQPIPPAYPWMPVESQNFIDWPMFQFWLPNAGFFIGENNSVNPFFGITLYNNSLLDSNAWDLSIGSQLFFLQPEFLFNFRTSAGPVDFITGISHTFSWINAASPFYREALSESFLVSVPLVERQEHNLLDFLQIYGGIRHSYLIDDANAFSFFNGFKPSLLAERNVLSAMGGVMYLHYRFGSYAEMFPIWSLVSAIDFLVPLPVFDETDTGMVLLGLFSYTLPGFADLHAVKVGVKAAYATDELTGTSWITPRGMFGLMNQTENGEFLLSLDYLFPLATLDAALFGGVHVNGIGMGLHAEMLADWNIGSPLFEFEHTLYVGLEFTFLAGIGALTVPFGAGISARLNLDTIQSFNIYYDLRPYFFVNLDSFFYARNVQNPARPRIRR